MKKALIILLCILTLVLLTLPIQAHSGGTDSNGGHYNRSTNEYHYHHGYSAHDHPNGVCPYLQSDKTDNTTNISPVALVIILVALTIVILYRKYIFKHWLNIVGIIFISIFLERCINTSLLFTIRCFFSASIIFTFIIGFIVGIIIDKLLPKVNKKINISFCWICPIVCYAVVFLSTVYAPTFHIMATIASSIANLYFLMLLCLIAVFFGFLAAFILYAIITSIFKGLNNQTLDIVYKILNAICVTAALVLALIFCLYYS